MSTLWVVLNAADEVVVMASGQDAAAFAAERADEGARVVEVRGSAVVAA
jgi:hypothetical protein